MVWAVTAVTAGAAVLGAVTSTRNADKDRQAMQQAQGASLAFDQERYDDFRETYGGIEENLQQYFEGVSADYYETIGLEAIEVEKQRSSELIRENLTQRGIDPDSGLALAADLNLEFDTMSKRADVRRSAPTVAANEQMRFLQVGLGQDPSESISNRLADNATSAEDRYNTSQARAGSAQQDAITTVGTALSDYLESRDNEGD